MDIAQLIISSLIGAIVGTLASGIVNVMLLAPLKRRLEQVDELKRSLRDINEARIERIEEQQKHMVTRADCGKLHEQQSAGMEKMAERMLATSIKLAEVSAAADRAVEWLGGNTNQLIAVQQELSAVAARVDEIKRRAGK